MNTGEKFLFIHLWLANHNYKFSLSGNSFNIRDVHGSNQGPPKQITLIEDIPDFPQFLQDNSGIVP